MSTQHHCNQAEIAADGSNVHAWSWIGRLFHRASTAIIDDVPAEIEACEMCREADCGGDKFKTCQTRLSFMAPSQKLPLR